MSAPPRPAPRGRTCAGRDRPARCRGSPCSRSPPPPPPRRRCARCRGCPERSGSPRNACPTSTWTDDRCTAFLNLCGSSSATTLPCGVEQVALAVALVDRAEVPAVAVVVGELGVLHLWVQLPDLLEELQVAPVAPGRRPFGVAVEICARCAPIGGVLLLRGPHPGRVGLVVPHGVAEEAVHEHVRLVHVADHALAGGDGAGERVRDGVAGLAPRDRWIGRPGGAVVAEGRVGAGVPGIAVVGVDDVAGGAARVAVVARLIVGAHEPGERVVQPRLGDVEHRHGDARAGAGAAVGLPEVGAARLLEPLQQAGAVRQPGLRETGCRCCARRARRRGRRRRA